MTAWRTRIFFPVPSVGKTTTRAHSGQAMNCIKGDAEPCGVCDFVQGIARRKSLDVIEMTPLQRGRSINSRIAGDGGARAAAIAQQSGNPGPKAHMLTGEASTLWLKTLEERPTEWIFVWPRPRKLEDTIRSRSQHFHFALDV